MPKVSSPQPACKGGCPKIDARRELWHEVLDALDAFEDSLVASKLLGAELSLALEQLHDIRESLLQARPRKEC